MPRHLVRSAAAALSLAAAATGLAAAPAHADSSISCVYTFQTWPNGFIANLAITNRGPDINGWTAKWTFDVPTTAVVGWGTNLTVRNDREVNAANAVYNASIPSGQTMMFGWSATAASTSVPGDITVNGVRC